MLTKPTPPMTDEQAERFWSRIEVNQPSGCWEWTAGTFTGGYGQFRIGDRTWQAHRIAYSTLIHPIPEGMVTDHLCRNPRCCNPDHLQIVTNTENTNRNYSPPSQNRRKTHCHKGHPFTPDNLQHSSRGNRNCRTCRNERNLRYKATARAKKRADFYEI